MKERRHTCTYVENQEDAFQRVRGESDRRKACEEHKGGDEGEDGNGNEGEDEGEGVMLIVTLMMRMMGELWMKKEGKKMMCNWVEMTLLMMVMMIKMT